MIEEQTLDDRVKAAMADITNLHGFVRDYNEILREGDYETLGRFKKVAEQVVFAGRDLRNDPDAQRELRTLREEWDCAPEDLLTKLREAYSPCNSFAFLS